MANTGVGLTRSEARWAIAQSGVAEMHAVLAYAEAQVVMAAGLGVTISSPEALARSRVLATLAGDLRWNARRHTFPVHLQKAIRLEVAGHLLLHARLRGKEGAAWDARLARTQLGDLRGIEQLAHWAGEMMAHIRSNETVMVQAAIKLADFVRRRLEPYAGAADDEDTARVRGPTSAGPTTPALIEVTLGRSDGEESN